MTPLLVIGFGNELRGDDGVGPRVARLVQSWGRPDVRAMAVPQLVPELAAELAAAERVMFVDAAVGTRRVLATRVEADCDYSTQGHVSTPGRLLALTGQVFGRNPQSWLVTVPASRFRFGAGLTAAAARGVRDALRYIAAHAVARGEVEQRA
jgi:hydrogenase maturation protease